MTHEEGSAAAKIRLRVFAPIMVLIVLSSLDRVNLSFASLEMNAQLDLTVQSYGLAASIFFVGYVLFQFPSTAVLTHIGARRWIAGSVVLWGIVAASMSFVQNAPQLYVMRFLLGAAESGFAPGIVYYCSGWLPNRYRANSIAITMLAIPISVVIGGPLCGWLMTVENGLGMPGWRWMLLMEGCVTIVCGFAAYFMFVDAPAQARWLTAGEQKWVLKEITDERMQTATIPKSPISAVLVDPRVWLGAGVWCTTLIGSNGLVFWLPQAMKELSTLGNFTVGVLAALPWVGVGIGMFANSLHSDRTQERFWHVGAALIVAALSFFAASAVKPGAAALLWLILGGVGLGAAQGVFWSIPTRFLKQTVAAAGITLINLVGNLGSLAGPSAIGFIREHSESFSAPIWFVAAMLCIGAMLLTALRSLQTAKFK